MDSELIAQAYTLGKLLYSPTEVATVLGLDPDEVILELADTSGEFYRSYHKGYFETDAQLRNSILKLAIAGSSPAQSMVTRMLANNIYKNAHD